MTERQRLDAVTATVCAGLLAAFALSPRLWLSDRTFPLTPIPPLPPLPVPTDYILMVGAAAALLATLAASAMRFRGRASTVPLADRWLPATVIALMVLAITDQQRWQPWFYQYTAMLAAVAISTRPGARTSATDALDACRTILAGIYLWSGVQKLNVSFLTLDFPWMVEPIVQALPGWAGRGLESLAVAVPVVEISVAAAVLSPRLRRAGVAAAIGTHAFILACLGPLGHDWNTIVWPWNVAMIALVVLLFGGHADPGWRRVLTAQSRAVNAVVIVLFWILPALSFADLWDSYLSACLYSRNTRRADVFVAAPVLARLPASVAARADDTGAIHPMSWALDELGVPVYPEPRVFKSVATELCRQARRDDQVILVISSRPQLVSGDRSTSMLECSDL